MTREKRKWLQKQMNQATGSMPITVKVKPKRSAKSKALTIGAIVAATAAMMPKISQWTGKTINQRNQAKAFKVAAKVTEKAQTKVVKRIDEVIDLTDHPQVKQAVDKADSALGELTTSLQQEARQRDRIGNGSSMSGMREHATT